MRDCPPFGQWQLDPANRGNSGSPAINDLSGTEAQSRQAGRLQAELCRATGASAALDGLSPRPGARPAPRGVGAPRTRLVARTGRRPARPGGWPPGDVLREALSLLLRPHHADDGGRMAPLSA